MQLAARLQRPAFAGSIRARGRALVARVAQSDTPSEAGAASPRPRAPPLESLELDAARPPQRPAISSLITPHNVLLINGRLAMMGTVAGLGGELLKHKPLAAQMLAAPPAVLALMAVLSVASIVPLLRGAQEGDEVFGPFTPAAEMLNGKVAIAGMVALLAIEAVKGSAIL